MRAIFVAVVALALTHDPAALAEPAAAPEYVEVIGRFENLDYQSTNDPEDLLGHGWMTARLHIVRIVRGPKLLRVVDVRYFGHTFYREDRPMRLKLKRGESGGYLVCGPRGGSGVLCP